MNTPDRDALLLALPRARRYARALTGAQAAGDALVAEALRSVLAAGATRQPRQALYAAISTLARGPGDEEPGTTRRMLLLLTSLEELPLAEAAAVLLMTPGEAEAELRAGREALRAGAAARVLIIEDEPVIALDLQDLVEGCGHSVVGLAATEAEAVAIALRDPPTLVLADVNLGAGGDGAHAVSRIQRALAVPVIFVTAYPERLLTGEAMEPAFVIAKPFDPTVLAVTTYQAVTRGLPRL